jgi:hypothetical protein
LWVSLLNLVLCMACSNFTIQMYVHTSNWPNLFFPFFSSQNTDQPLPTFRSFEKGLFLY